MMDAKKDELIKAAIIEAARRSGAAWERPPLDCGLPLREAMRSTLRA